MSLLVRIIETLTGRPHQHHNAEMVSAATRNLLATTANFSKKIEPYSLQEFPLDALIHDIKNQRKRAQGNNGTTTSKFHS